MAIDAYTGLPGSGKSHTVVQYVVLPALKENLCVVTNIPMKREEIDKEFPGADLRVFDVQKFEALGREVTNAKNEKAKLEAEAKLQAELDADLPKGCVWVLDEVWRLWPAGQKTDKVPEPFKAMLAEHRHRAAHGRSMQIALVTQDLSQVGKFARDLVETTYRTEKLGALGLSKRYRVDVYRSGVTGARPPANLLQRKMFGRYSKEVWKYYESHTKREGEGAGAEESKIDKRGQIWRSKFFLVVLPFMLALFVYGIYGTWRFFSPAPPERPTVGKERSRPPSTETRGEKRQVKQDTWRITAFMEGGGVDRVWLEDGARAVDLPIGRYCDKDVDGYLICEFEGQRISNQIRRVNPATGSITARALFGQVVTSSEGL